MSTTTETTSTAGEPIATAPVLARPAQVPAPPAAGDRLYRLSVEQYHQMARAGILTKYDRVELIEGLLVLKMTKNERHLTSSWRLLHALIRGLPDGWLAVPESPLVLGRSEPEPDILILRGRVENYDRQKPRPEDIGLVIEVSDSSYAEDRARRALFAAAGIACYWIVNIPAGRIEVHTDPTGPDAQPDYRRRRDFGRDDEIAIVLDGREALRLRVGDLLPPTENAAD